MRRKFIGGTLVLCCLSSFTTSFVIPGLTTTGRRSTRGNANNGDIHSQRRTTRGEARMVFSKRSVSNVMHASLATTDECMSTTDFLICGGGPAGLLAAIMLAQKFPNCRCQVYDRQPTPASTTDDSVWDETSRHYLIGLGGRGLISLETCGINIQPYAVPVPGRKDWTPQQPNGVESIRDERKYGTQVLPRDKLVSVLHEVILKEYSDQVDLYFETEVRPLQFDYGSNDDEVLVEVSPISDGEKKWTKVVAKMVLAADGTARTFANRIEEMDSSSTVDPFRIVRFQDDNIRVYKSLPFRLPEKQWLITQQPEKEKVGDVFWNYAVRSEKNRVLFDALPANDRGDYVGILLMRPDEPMAQSNVNPNDFKDFLRQEIPQFLDVIQEETIIAAASTAASSFPQFRYVSPRMHQGKRTVLLGDCAHSVKPFFGLGCNTALEDVKLLGECLEESPDDWTSAIYSFSKQRTPEMTTLVETSHDLDRPGLPGVFFFLIPIILDGIFFKLAPQVFQPNIISLLQNEECTFQGAVRRKQLDRTGQLLILGTVFYLMGSAVVTIAGFVGDLFGGIR